MKAGILCLVAGMFLNLGESAVIQTPPKGAFVAKLHSEVDGNKINNLFIDMEGLFDNDDSVYEFSNDPDGKQDRDKRLIKMSKGNIAQQILQLQLKLQEERSLQSIKNLNDVYMKGIDYYIDEDPKKAKLMHKKMQNLLARPSIIDVLEKNASLKHLPQQQEENNFHKSVKKQIVRFETNAQTQILNLIQKSNDCQRRVQNLKNKDINRQQQQLYDRMLSRVKSHQKIRQFKSCKNIQTKKVDQNYQ